MTRAKTVPINNEAFEAYEAGVKKFLSQGRNIYN